MKLLGKWVRLPDGREGHVAGSGIDGLTVVVEGRLVQVLPQDVVEIPPPVVEPPSIQRTVQQPPIQTNHTELPAQVKVPPNMSVLQNGQWANTTWPLGSK